MQKVSKKKRKKTKGFTLIELLVVVAIIGILAAIAIPQFALYRQKGFNARMEADARNAATAQESWFVDNNTYLAGNCSGLQGMSVSQGDTCTMAAGNSGQITTSFAVTVTNPSASYTSCVWTSDPAGTQNLVCT